MLLNVSLRIQHAHDNTQVNKNYQVDFLRKEQELGIVF